jgi:site-specific DNA-methyltransferase (adenine-specific)
MTAPQIEHLSDDITLYRADCRDIVPLITTVDAVLTDPPYGIPHNFGIKRTPSGNRRLQFTWDNENTTDIVLSACAMAAHLGSAQLWFCGLHQVSYIADILLDAGMVPKPAAWVKKCPPPAIMGNWWPSGFEYAIYAYRRGAWFGEDDPKRSNVWIADSYRHGQPGKVQHPTQKPLGLITRLVRAIVPSNGTVLDMFMGSGTTGVAAVRLARKFIGIEIDQQYFDLACRRIEDELQRPRLPLDELKQEATQEQLL